MYITNMSSHNEGSRAAIKRAQDIDQSLIHAISLCINIRHIMQWESPSLLLSIFRHSNGILEHLYTKRHLIESKDIGNIGHGIDKPEDHQGLKRSFGTTENTHEAVVVVVFFIFYLFIY